MSTPPTEHAPCDTPCAKADAELHAQKNNEPVATTQAQNQAAPTPDERFVSPGDKAFDIGVYGGLNGIVTFLLSLVAGYSARHGKFAKVAERWSEGLQKRGISKDVAENTVMTTALMMGGNAMILPVKGLENHRTEIVNGINDSVGHPHVAKEEQLEQTWGSLIKGRFVAWAMVFASFKAAVTAVGPEKFEKFEHDFARNVVCKPLNRPTHTMGQETKLYRYGRIAALDSFATAAAATLLYFSSRFFAKQNQLDKEKLSYQSKPEDIPAPVPMSDRPVVSQAMPSEPTKPLRTIENSQEKERPIQKYNAAYKAQPNIKKPYEKQLKRMENHIELANSASLTHSLS